MVENVEMQRGEGEWRAGLVICLNDGEVVESG